MTANSIEELPRILYIMGTGRSGTTMVEVLLADNPDIVSAGELTHIFQDGFLDDQPCACGNATSACPLWSQVLARCGWDRDELREIVALHRRVERHSRFPWVALGLLSRTTLDRYRTVNARLFAALAAVSGASVVIDSSKYAGRALTLARCFPGRVSILSVSRAPRALIAAFQKRQDDEQHAKHPFAAAIYCLYVGLCARGVRRRLGDATSRLRYEALQAAPVEEINAIERWAGIDLSATRTRLAEDGVFEPGHIVTGNRLRKRRAIRFRRTAEQREPEGTAAQFASRLTERLAALLRL